MHYALLACFIFLFVSPVFADNTEEKLPLPRFAALKSNKINMRVGPGENFPIVWVYKKSGLPVEIIEEHQLWRKVRDPEGDEGWMLKNLLTGKRNVIVSSDSLTLRRKPDRLAPEACRANQGVIFTIDECRKDWCLIHNEKGKGWAEKKNLWGVYAQEILQD